MVFLTRGVQCCENQPLLTLCLLSFCASTKKSTRSNLSCLLQEVVLEDLLVPGRPSHCPLLLPHLLLLSPSFFSPPWRFSASFPPCLPSPACTGQSRSSCPQLAGRRGSSQPRQVRYCKVGPPEDPVSLK